MAGRELAEMILDQVQMFDKKVTASGFIAQKSPDLLKSFRIDLTAFWIKRRRAAFIAATLVASSYYFGVR